MKRWYFIVLVFLTTCIYAQDVTFTATAPGVVEVGQQFRLTYSVNSQAERFLPPNLDGFVILAGPSTSTSSNVSIINGKMTQNYELRYTYILEAAKEGEFTISSAEVTVDKKKYTSNTLKIEVIKGSGQQSQTRQNPAATQPQNTENSEPIATSDLFLKIIVNKTKTFREEHLIATIKLYSKLNITNLGEYRPPAFDGFIAEKIEVPPLTRLNQENVNGQIYLTGVIDKYILYPQTTGEIEIKPFELVCYYQAATRRRSGSMFDEFFGTYERAQTKAFSSPVKIKVQTLPENKPASFAGAIGNLKMDASLDKTNTKTNEAITLRIKISGNGNLKYINAPKIEFPSDFDVYDPKISDNIKYSDNGATGSKTFEYLLIPRHAGEFTIPEFEFSNFDTNNDQYKIQKAGPYNINVLKGADDTTMALANVFSKEDIKFLGKDIHFIKKDNSNLKLKDKFIFGSTWFYLSFLIALALFVLTFFLRRKMILENANTQLVRTRKADKYARKRLQKASEYLKHNKKEDFYEELAKALWGYISDKFSIPISGLSKESANQQMILKGIEQTFIDQVLGIIDRCEYARYAPASESTQMDTLFTESVDIISKLQQQYKG
ncbi:MAG: hypothetical protein A2W99_01675 [Bacteroidetes bacterium GWF2_33_16]|nr:MAG: hypothetical protein A2X00_16480 [Bacteroidetes bacterium GWE2_32_14]OFY06980.1 MAG: hypothetical protein A2W99_01675 [Bacteroidetes bacterium GWF2_33_16]